MPTKNPSQTNSPNSAPSTDSPVASPVSDPPSSVNDDDTDDRDVNGGDDDGEGDDNSEVSDEDYEEIRRLFMEKHVELSEADIKDFSVTKMSRRGHKHVPRALHTCGRSLEDHCQ